MMSSEQATLAEAFTVQGQSRERGQTSAWTPSTGSGDGDLRCQNCNRHVNKDFARVFCVDEGEVHACFGCKTFAEIQDGAASDPDHEWRHKL